MRLDVMRCHGLQRPTSGSKIGTSEGQLDYIPYSWNTLLNKSKVTRISRFFYVYPSRENRQGTELPYSRS